MQEQAGTSGSFCPACGQPRAEDERFCKRCDQLLVGPNGVRAAGIGQRVLAYILDIVLVCLYPVYWIFDLVADRARQRPDTRQAIVGHLRNKRQW